MALLRQAGYDRPFYVHGALQPLSALYGDFGIELGDLRSVTPENKGTLVGEIVLAPPGATSDRWSRGLPEPLSPSHPAGCAFASGPANEVLNCR